MWDPISQAWDHLLDPQQVSFVPFTSNADHKDTDSVNKAISSIFNRGLIAWP